MRRLHYIIAAIVLVIAILLPLPIKQNLAWIDSISGMRKSQTVWRPGWSSSPAIVDSPLAMRYRRLGLTWEPQWCNVVGTHVNVLGRRVGTEHGPAPEIYSLALHPRLQEAFLAASNDDEVRAFFNVMCSGSAADQGAAVEAACAKGMESLSR